MAISKNRKRIKFIAIGAALSLFSSAVGYAAGEWENIWVQFDSVNLTVNGQNVTSSNLLYNDRTYVPLRACAEMLGSTVEWSQTSNTASITANVAGSADTTKVISDMQLASNMMYKLDLIYSLGTDLYICYKDCVSYANDITTDAFNRDSIHTNKINFFNETIETYNNYLEYINFLNNGGINLKLSLPDMSKLMDLFGNSIDNLKAAYNSLYQYDNSKNKTYLNDAELKWKIAWNSYDEGQGICSECSKIIYNFIQEYK